MPPSRSPLSPVAGARAVAVVALGLLAAAPAVPAADPGLRAALQRRVAEAKRSIPSMGVHVVELEGGSEVYAFEADRSLVPASNQKLLTTAMALDRLGPGYFFETSLGLRGQVADGVLHGDLAVRGGGDPTISGRLYAGDPYGPFAAWAKALRDRGVRRVDGDLWLEHGLFDGPVVHPEWPREQLDKWYEAPVAALSFSDNVFLVRAWGGSAAGRPAVVDAEPFFPLGTLRNRLTTISDRRKHTVSVRRAAASGEVDVSGRVYVNASPTGAWVTVEDPVAYFGEALRRALAAEGIEIGGEVRPVETLPGPWWELVHVHRTSLLAALAVTNKRSQNFFAESLFKLLAARECGEGSWEEGARLMARYWEETLGWDPARFVVRDGSGMARGNRVTARQLTELLGHMFRHRWGRAFMESLPYSGEEEGSLHERMDDPPYRGNVFAKTGTLANVSTLSGYAKGASGKLYAFSILTNGAAAWQGRRAQDRIVMALVDNG